MSEENEVITFDEVAGNVLSDFDSMRPEDKDYEKATRAVDMVMRHVDEAKRQESEAERVKAQLEFERQKYQEEIEQLKRQNEIKEKEVKVAKITAITGAAIGIGTLVRDCVMFHTGLEFEKTGTFRSVLSKMSLNRLFKK